MNFHWARGGSKLRRVEVGQDPWVMAMGIQVLRCPKVVECVHIQLAIQLAIQLPCLSILRNCSRKGTSKTWEVPMACLMFAEFLWISENRRSWIVFSLRWSFDTKNLFWQTPKYVFVCAPLLERITVWIHQTVTGLEWSWDTIMEWDHGTCLESCPFATLVPLDDPWTYRWRLEASSFETTSH